LAGCGRGKQEEASQASGGEAASDTRQQAAEDGRAAQEDLAEPNKAEARAWLADGSHALFEGSKDDVKALVDDLYGRGAVEVWVTGIETLGGTEVTASIVVVLPEDSSTRARVFERANAFWTTTGEDAFPDVGQTHLRITLD
jgi:hypothetical protein